MRLTIDPEIQTVIEDAFNATFEKYSGGGQSILPNSYSELRRAGFVLLDLQATSGPGAVLAAVAHPSYEITATDWDLEALSFEESRNSPLSFFGWDGVDGRMTPGSSFKVLSAITLIQAATGGTRDIPVSRRNNIRDAILGMPVEAYRRRITLPDRGPINLDAPDMDIPVTAGGDAKFRDSHRRAPLNYARSNLNSAACGDPTNGDIATYDYGLCEALALSSNIWFAGMALHTDLEKIQTLADGTSIPNYPVASAQQLVELGFHRRIALMRADPDLDLDDTLLPRGSQVVHELHRNFAVWRLLVNGNGRSGAFCRLNRVWSKYPIEPARHRSDRRLCGSFAKNRPIRYF